MHVIFPFQFNTQHAKSRSFNSIYLEISMDFAPLMHAKNPPLSFGVEFLVFRQKREEHVLWMVWMRNVLLPVEGH